MQNIRTFSGVALVGVLNSAVSFHIYFTSDDS